MNSPLKGLKRLRKPWSKLTQLPQLDGYRIRERRPFDPPVYVSTARQTFDITDDAEDRLANQLGDRGLARRIVRLQKQNPYGTIPELICVDYLDQNQFEYIYQAKMFGGFRQGGIVPDFLVKWGGGWLCILINGSYWHNRPGMVMADELDVVRLKGSNYQGYTIREAVIVWENRLLAQPNIVMQAALAGINLGQ